MLLKKESQSSGSVWRVFLVLVLLGFALRTAYGIVRYRNGDLVRSGDAFVRLWDHDALEHVLIAKALVEGKGYIVDAPPSGVSSPVRFVGQPALFKAPFYEFFLAGVFSVSGFCFAFMFPLQALLGGLVAGLTALIALRVFRNSTVAWIAGALAAIHPLLVNSASQPYNESLFFFLCMLAIWSFLNWQKSFQKTMSWRWAMLCGLATGVATLTRENALLLLPAFAVATIFQFGFTTRMWTGLAVLFVSATTAVLPWTLRNYLDFRIFLPVASIVGEDLSEGNNSCIANESIFMPYWAEGPCVSLNQQRHAEMLDARYSGLPAAVRRDRISKRIATKFIQSNPATYVKLSFRRLWTTVLPYDPRGDQRKPERLALLIYWLLVFPAAILGSWRHLKRLEADALLLLSIIFLNLLSIAMVLYWSDLRFRVGIDLLAGSFAASVYAELLAEFESKRRSQPQAMLMPGR